MAGLFTKIVVATFAVVLLTSAIQCRKPLVKAPQDADKTGQHIVVLKKDSSKKDLDDVISRIKRMSEDAHIHRYTEHVGKTITVNAPEHVLEKV